MGFSEALKLRVKHDSLFRCCRCQEIGVEIHHIIPQAEGGPDTYENAAPLCPTCHSQFGDNPKKRKEITEMRDHWYSLVQRKMPVIDVRLTKIEAMVSDLLNEVAKINSPDSTKDLLKKYLNEFVEARLNSLSQADAKTLTTAIMNGLSSLPGKSNNMTSSVDSYIESKLGDLSDRDIRTVASTIVNTRREFMAGSPCQMSGQSCPARDCKGIMDVSPDNSGVVCGACGIFIPA